MSPKKAEELIEYHKEQIEALKDKIKFHEHQIEMLKYELAK